MTAHAERAKQFLTPTTSDPAKLEIYLEATNDGIYYHSNFVTPGMEHPTKLHLKRPVDLDTAILNILYASQADVVQGVPAATRANLQLHLDQSMFDSNGFLRADVASYGTVRVVNGSTRQTLPLGEIRTLNLKRPPPTLLGRIAGCCLHGIPPFAAARFAQTLEKVPFAPERFRIMSLVRDSATERVLAETPALSGRRVGASIDQLTSKEQVLSEIRAHGGKQLGVLGHVEGVDFVIRAPDNSVQLSIPVAEMVRVADEAGTTLMLFGCRSAEQLNVAEGSLGVIESFNSVRAAQYIGEAAGTARNQREFLEGMSRGEFNLVVDGKFIASQERLLAAGVYARQGDRPVWRRIADLLLLFPKNAAQA